MSIYEHIAAVLGLMGLVFVVVLVFSMAWSVFKEEVLNR